MLTDAFTRAKKAIQANLLFSVLCVAWAVATFAFLTHALEKNPQYDTQGIRYAGEFLDALAENKAAKWLTDMPPRKYPMGYIAPFAGVYKGLEIVLRGTDNVTLPMYHLAARIVTLLYTLGTILLLILTARYVKLRQTDVLLLLFSSLLFFLFATAVRPHGAVMFWTILSYYCSLRLRDRLSVARIIFSFAAAACAFMTLQSGIFAFLFPVWAVLQHGFTKKNSAIILCAGAFFFLVGAIGGYPFLLHGILHTQSGALDTSLGHDIGFAFTPALIPVKLWSLFISELVLGVFVVMGSIQLFRQQAFRSHPLFPAVCYSAVFLLAFIAQPITATRFFLPLFPLWALIGSMAFIRLPTYVRPALTVCFILVYTQCAYLGFMPDTFDRASDFMRDKTGMIAVTIPGYFLTLPVERFIQSDTQLPDATFIVSNQEENLPGIPLCASFISSRYAYYFAENKSPFLWNAVEWPLAFVFETRMLGPNLYIYCR